MVALQTTWNKQSSLANHGYWTNYNETWYQQQLSQLKEEKDIEPLMESEWKSWLYGNLPKTKVKSIWDNNLKFASKVMHGLNTSIAR